MEMSRRSFMTVCGAAVAGQVMVPRKVIASIAIERKEWKVAELTLELFKNYVGQTFTVACAPHGVITLTLASVKEHPGSRKTPPNGGPVLEMFTLVFEGPLEKSIPQNLYSFDHVSMGTFELFMVPVHSKNTAVRRYEIAFNRIVSK